MSKIDEKTEKAANEYAEQEAKIFSHTIAKGITFIQTKASFIAGAKWALSHQWRSVEEDGLPKPKDYETYLLPCGRSDKPAIYVVNSFMLLIEYKDGGHDYCEASFKVLSDGRHYWLMYDDYFASLKIEDYKVTHWMPLSPPPKALKKVGDFGKEVNFPTKAQMLGKEGDK